MRAEMTWQQVGWPFTQLISPCGPCPCPTAVWMNAVAAAEAFPPPPAVGVVVVVVVDSSESSFSLLWTTRGRERHSPARARSPLAILAVVAAPPWICRRLRLTVLMY